MRCVLAVVIFGGAMLCASATAQPPNDVALTSAPLDVLPEPRPEEQAEKLSTTSSISALLADPRAKDILIRHAPQVVEFFAAGQSQTMAPGNTPLAGIAEFPQAQDAGLTPENMKKIADELEGL